jgi:Secretion system C-terminal sorting domain
MKKTILFIFGFLFIVSTVFAQNLVTNGDLELWTASDPDNWDHVENITQESTNIHGGTYSARHESASGTKDFGHEFTAGITAGNDYTLSFWYLDNDIDARFRLWSKWKDAGGTTVGETIETAYSTDDPNWIQYSNTITAPAGATQFYLEVRAYKNASGVYGGYVYYDDFSLTDDGGATPAINKAYAISSDELEVFYNLDLTTVTASDFELTGTATITFTTATIDGTNAKLVHLSGASTAMADDNTLDAISDDTTSTNDFYAGITSISYTNTLNPGGMIDDTNLATFQGIVSANDANNMVWVSDATGAYNGVAIYSYTFDALVAVGDEILFTADRTAYNGLTELEHPELISVISSGNSPYGPDVIAGSDIDETLATDTNPGESWEGQLVQINTFYVESTGDFYYRCTDDGGVTYFYVGDNVDYQLGNAVLIVGQTYQSIIGVVDWYNSGPYYRINPRDGNDPVLPVTLSSFTAEYLNNSPVLYWTTQSEINNLGWDIFRSVVENGFDTGNSLQITTSMVPGIGASTEPTDYSYSDEFPIVEGVTYYYWLQSTSATNDIDFFGPISLTIPIQGEIPHSIFETALNPNYPNPFNPATTISFSIENENIGTFTIFNIKGQEVVSEKYEAGEYTIEWNAEGLSSGIYFYKLSTPSFNITKKMILMK